MPRVIKSPGTFGPVSVYKRTPKHTVHARATRCTPPATGVPFLLVVLFHGGSQEDMCFEGMKPVNQTAAASKGLRGLLHPQQLQLMSRQLDDPNGSFANAEMSELSVAQKPEKLLERCKYWPACKNGDECAYHHPVSPCKAFPNCKFAEKCLFVHPNCKYDAKCTKPDCPFTHMSRRIPVLPLKPAVTTPAPPSSSQLCRYFPACKKMECPFYHPKVRIFIFPKMIQ
ncbi:zinc finger CCCH domain-containing protein 14-like [Puma concolor]|uniref:Zinc finger CCCH domain-containing protein 14 n=1 Tax=Puma concolor TaxID=9696 RepID=A0A6P6HH84_PUMCO|nr:zinc finger CCCH domain-containing protein 14-like [Puma concolor]